MSANSSSHCNASLPPLSFYCFLNSCINSTPGVFSITAFAIISILVLLPLYILVIYLGLQRWWKQRSGATMSHSDHFTYHMVGVELISVVASILSCCGVHADIPDVWMVGLYLSTANLLGQILFHILTCVERYLAIVHPITYLSLRKAKGIRIRNITIGCVWLICVAGTGVASLLTKDSIFILSYCTFAVTLIIISFCSLSVLCVLIRPGPGEGGGGRQRVDQSKLRAFYTIMAILGVLLLKVGWTTLCSVLYTSPQLGLAERCFAWLSILWFGLPSSLVLPLLFIHRAGKLLCCKNNNESGQRSD